MKIEALGSAMIAEVDEIRKAQVVRLQPGDLLVLISDCELGERAVARIRETLVPHLPEDVPLVVLEQARFEVIRAEESE